MNSNLNLIKLPDGNYVNPSHVTAIEMRGGETFVWVFKDSGYHTGAFRFKGDRRDYLAKLLAGADQ